MPIKFAVIGVRHGHIQDLIARIKEREDTELVAVCEEDETTRNQLLSSGQFSHVYGSYGQMLDEVECEAIAVGDYYSVRGPRVIEALHRGKHVIGDKPLCTRLDELDEIARMVRDKKLALGCMLDFRSNGAARRLKRLIAEGELGKIVALNFDGQHPLIYGTRPGWYFEEGKHGGTLNDIAVHAIDYIPWMTGLQFSEINAARNWNMRMSEAPHFKDAAQMMLTLENGAGVLGDVSYCAPDSFGYTFPLYWRTTVWGDQGVAEMALNRPLVLYKNGESESRELEPDPAAPGEYLDAFLEGIKGQRNTALTPEEILASSRMALQIQQAADNNATGVKLIENN